FKSFPFSPLLLFPAAFRRVKPRLTSSRQSPFFPDSSAQPETCSFEPTFCSQLSNHGQLQLQASSLDVTEQAVHCIEILQGTFGIPIFIHTGRFSVGKKHPQVGPWLVFFSLHHSSVLLPKPDHKLLGSLSLASYCCMTRTNIMFPFPS